MWDTLWGAFSMCDKKPKCGTPGHFTIRVTLGKEAQG